MPPARTAGRTTTGSTGRCRTRSGPRPRRTRAAGPPSLPPAAGSARHQGTPSARGRAPQDFFWGGDGDGPDALELQAQPLEELADLAGLAADAGEGLDPLTGLGDGPGRLPGELVADTLGVGGRVAARPGDAPGAEAVEAALAEGGAVALDGGPAEAGDLGRLL